MHEVLATVYDYVSSFSQLYQGDVSVGCASVQMFLKYALCASGVVNMQLFYAEVFLCAIHRFSFIHSFIHSFIQHLASFMILFSEVNELTISAKKTHTHTSAHTHCHTQ